MSASGREKSDSKRKRSKSAEDKAGDAGADRKEAVDSDAEDLVKRVKALQTSDSMKDHEKDVLIAFKSPEDIQQALNSLNTDLLIQGFMHLSEHLKICNQSVSNDTTPAQRAHQESCQRIVYQWAAGSDNFASLEQAWQNTYTYSISRLDSLIPNVVGQLLKTFDTAAGMKYGNRLAQVVLDTFMKPIYRALNMPRSAACVACLQLLYQAVVFGRGEHADRVLRQFDWTLKTLVEMPNTRAVVVGFSIRRLWIRFVLAFFSAERCRSYNELFRVRSLVSNLFICVEKDSYADLHVLLTSVYEHIVLNEGISRADKVRVFSVGLMASLAKAAKTTAPVKLADVGVERAARFVPKGAGGEADEIASDSMSALVIRFFRGMMTFPGHGICFPQYGLYPAQRGSPASAARDEPGSGGDSALAAAGAGAAAGDDDGDDGDAVAVLSKDGTFAGTHDLCNSQILRILVHALHPAASKRMGDLAVDIMRVSPELIAPFWRNYHPTFDARLSLRYLGNMAFATKVIGIGLPQPADAADARFRMPPRLGTLVEHVYPQPLQRHVIGHGLQFRASPLVVYRNLLAVDVALRKLDGVRAWIQRQVLRGGGARGGVGAAWARLDQGLVALVRQRVPEAKVVLAMQRVVLASFGDARDAAGADERREAACREAVFRNVLVRVVSGYQRHFNALLLEHNFELGRLLADVRLADSLAGAGGQNPLNAHTLLSLLRALETTPAAHTRWLARVDGLAGHTYLGTVAMLYLYAPQPEVRAAAQRVCLGALRATGLFDHDAQGEAACWLDALALLASPHAQRATRIAEAPAAALERARGLVAFLESAVVYAAKQPNKYADCLSARPSAEAAAAAAGQEPLLVSPLLAAVVEAAVLRMAAGSGPLAQRVRGAGVGRLAAEMRANAAFAYVREVACRVGEVVGPGAAEALDAYLARAAAVVLAPRAARVDAQSDEHAHYAAVLAAFDAHVADTRAYLALLCAVDKEGGGEGGGGNGPAEVPAAVGQQLAAAFTGLCADFEGRLDAFMDAAAAALVEHEGRVGAHALTLWLLARAAGAQGDARQMALIVCVRWITQHERVPGGGGPRQSLWASAAFRGLAPEILQADDAAFLGALLRHLLAARQPRLLGTPAVQRMLVHVLLASRGSAGFAACARLLLRQQLAAGPAGQAPFVFALVAAHTAGLPAHAAAHVLAQYSQLTGALPGASHTAEFGLARLARRSAAAAWPTDAAAAARIWAPLVARVRQRVADALAEAAADHAALAYALGLARVVGPAAAPLERVEVARMLCARAADIGDADAAAVCALAVAAHEMLEGAAHVPADVAALRAALGVRVVALWAAKAGGGGGGGGGRRMLTRAAAAVTAAGGAASGGLPARIAAARARLVRPVDLASAAAVDVARVLGRVHRRAAAGGLACTADARGILARLLRAGAADMRRRACQWALGACAAAEGCCVEMLAWLAHVLALPCAAASGVDARVDVDAGVRGLCVAVGARMSGAEDLGGPGMLLVAGVFVQAAPDAAAVGRFCDALGPARMPAEIVRARARRAALPAGVALGLLADAVEMALRRVAAGAEAGVLAEAAAHVMHSVPSAGSDEDAAAAIGRCYAAVDALVRSVCLELDADNAYWPAARVLALAAQTPACVFRLLAFAALAVRRATCATPTPTPTPQLAPHPWFATLRMLLRCRLFGLRMQDAAQRDGLALLVGALWELSAPHLSRWSAELSDYLALDELESLAGAYSGTSTASDLLLLHVLVAYEDATRQSVLRVMLVFGPSAADLYRRRRVGNAQYLLERAGNLVGEVDDDVLADAMAVVDEQRMLRSLVEFPVDSLFARAGPVERMAELLSNSSSSSSNGAAAAVVVGTEENYDPRFVLRWLWAVLSSGCPVDHRRLVESNALGMALAALASAHPATRRLAYYVLDVFYAQFSSPDAPSGWFSGKRQCLLLLDSLRNAIVRTPDGASGDEFPRLPFTTALFAATSLPLMLRPEHAMFCDLNRFLLKQAWLELDEIPLVRSTLCALTDARRQRVHVLRLAAQGARDIDRSWRWFARCRIVDTLLTLAPAPLGDVATGRAALTLLLHLSARENPRALVRHVAKNRFAMLAWVRHQVALEANALAACAARARLERPAGGHALYVRGMRAALVNLAVLLRVVLRVVANFSLVARGCEGAVGFNKFWVARSGGGGMAGAVGMGAVGDVVGVAVRALAQCLPLVGGLDYGSDAAVVGPALAVLRTCVDASLLLSAMQRAVDASVRMPQAPGIVRGVLRALLALEPLVGRDSDAEHSAAPAVSGDPCSLQSVALARSVDLLFCVPGDGEVMGAYGAVVEALARWCAEDPRVCQGPVAVEVLARARAVGVLAVCRALDGLDGEAVGEA
ncbi:hypothetical protein LPJ53_000726 [Coemansia erecta]|uniref:Nucleolar pre-ribosomal-associated protein 1 n=1 Tax=Coemansia erecta TaxID=147472 RepID=A0A9W7Y5H7_9FUNG|nr:hypothetical protein LPJ53_000726 [Coemansia erecta]